MPRERYITTSIAYPNGNPHLGHALEYVQADFLARYWRQAGEEVYFLTGLDEHGLKIQQAAEKEGKAPLEFVNSKAEVFKELIQRLEISADRFIRTTDPDHLQMAQALWVACAERGDIYKKRYQAWYNLKEEDFLGLVSEFPDPAVFNIDLNFVREIDEENYFFALSRYKDRIVEALRTKQYRVVPDSKLHELLNFIETHGLDDISISREASKLAWGLPVPNDPEQVMYVWFDALTNYLTGAGSVGNLQEIVLGERWPASIHCIGKDISRFHAIIWTGMLLSAGIALPEELLIHGFLTAGGQKMSKSLGNGVDPVAVIERFGTDPVRWFLLKEVPTTDDADFSPERVLQVYLADLANDFGNLVSRVWTMVQKYSEGKVPKLSGEQVAKISARGMTEDCWQRYHAGVEERAFNISLTSAHELIIFCNRLIDEKKPWVMAKDPAQRQALEELLYTLLEIVRHYSVLIRPAMPEIADRIFSQLFTEKLPQNFAGASKWGLLSPGSKLGENAMILFPKNL